MRLGRVLVAMTGAAAVTLLAASPASAQPSPTPSGGGHTSGYYIQVTTSTQTGRGTPGGKLSVDRLLRGQPKLAQHVGAGAAPRGATPDVGGDDMTIDECRANASSFAGNGWGKTRFVSCQAKNLHAWHVECWWVFCETVGTADVEVTDIQRSHNAGRDVDVVQVFNNWRLNGDIAELALSADITCAAAQGFGPCTPSPDFHGPYVQTIGQWAAEGSVTSRYYSFDLPGSAGTTSDLIAYAHLNWHFAIVGGENGPETVDGPDSQFRCDSATYIVDTNAGEGCVFPWVTETAHFHVSATPESANHILLAQFHPDQTVPPVANKSIPGAPGTLPLHRTAVQSDIDAHRATAVAACHTYFPGYDTAGKDCDEYPFASTLEGASDTNPNYSVDPIDPSDNRAAGGVLGAFYTYRRILGANLVNDPFYVQVDP